MHRLLAHAAAWRVRENYRKENVPKSPKKLHGHAGKNHKPRLYQISLPYYVHIGSLLPAFVPELSGIDSTC